MSEAILYMSVSLDGFVAGPNEGLDNPLGDGGRRLHEWVVTDADADHKEPSDALTGVNGHVYDELLATGAVVAGRGTFEPAGGWGGDRRSTDLHPHPLSPRRAQALAARYLRERCYECGDSSQRACGRQGRARARRHNRFARAGRWRPRRDRAACGARHPRPGAPVVRRTCARADRAGAHQNPRGGERGNPYALPGAALRSALRDETT
jgi:hypothetical protein